MIFNSSVKFETAVVKGLVRTIQKFNLITLENYKCILLLDNKAIGGIRYFDDVNEVKKFLAKNYQLPASRFARLISGQEFYIANNENDEQYIQCSYCGMKSYHPKDIEHKYCANCKKFLLYSNITKETNNG